LRCKNIINTFAPAFKAKKLVEGLKEIGFRLREEGKWKKRIKPEKISQFFWKE
jgi:hypothetical protein